MQITTPVLSLPPNRLSGWASLKALKYFVYWVYCSCPGIGYHLHKTNASSVPWGEKMIVEGGAAESLSSKESGSSTRTVVKTSTTLGCSIMPRVTSGWELRVTRERRERNNGLRTWLQWRRANQRQQQRNQQSTIDAWNTGYQCSPYGDYVRMNQVWRKETAWFKDRSRIALPAIGIDCSMCHV